MIRNQGRIVLSLALSLVIWSCSAAPQLPLSRADKETDFRALIGNFDKYYAPIGYKASQDKDFNFEAMKEEYLKQAMDTPTNEEYYGVVHRFVARFKDAHTGAMFLPATVRQDPTPGHARVAYLGFSGVRKGEGLLVTSLLPSINASSKFAILRGDWITKIDGVSLKEYIQKELVPYRDLGQDSSNLTYHMNNVFNRFSLALPIPKADWVSVSLERGKKQFEFKLPWIIKDFVTFLEEQQAAVASAEAAADLGDDFDDEASRPDRIERLTQGKYQFYSLASLLVNADQDFWNKLQKLFLGRPSKTRLFGQFVFMDALQIWNHRAQEVFAKKVLLAKKFNLATKDSLARLQEDRVLPAYAGFLRNSRTAVYPTYFLKTVYKKQGPDLPTEETSEATAPPPETSDLVAYIYLDTFSPEGKEDDEDGVVSEFKNTLKYLSELKIKNIVLDLQDNPGGSLSLSLRLAQALTPKKITLPSWQLRADESTSEAFKMYAQSGDPEAELYRRASNLIEKSIEKKQRLTEPLPLENLFTFRVQPDPTTPSDLNVVVLVNELCVSACDIFSAIVKDNQIATLMGTKTLGGGGDVIIVPNLSPLSQMILTQTHSLLVRSNSSRDYIENQGIVPDIEFDATTGWINLKNKYTPIIAKATRYLLEKNQPQAPVPAPN